MAENKKEDKLHNIRHSLAHILAIAALKLDPKAKLGVGPVIDNGFYYDFLFSRPMKEADLETIEKAMREVIAENLPFIAGTLTEKDASKLFAKQPFKFELAKDLSGTGEELTTYQTGNFVDLCRGGHIKNTSELKKVGFKLERMAGAYWKSDEKREQLTRVYGLAFETEKQLAEYLTMMEEAKKRDHRKIGKELQLFTIIDEVGPGLPLFYPKGALMRRLIENYIIEEQEKRGYVPIWIPHITRGKLYEVSGHLDKYDAMYTPMLIDEDKYYLKPMNCPHFMMLYRSLPHSYRELPLRYTCTTTNYRYEKSGELSGLTRVRSLTQDDCHVFCTPDQIEAEISLMLEMIGNAYKVFTLKDFWVRVSLRDPKNKAGYLGDDAVWETSENALRKVVKKTGWISKEAEGEAAFYGPKLDFMAKDAIGREWQLSTIQLDFNLPQRFELEYATKENTKERPVVIHRAILGSTERFMGVLIEHLAGNFPTWLAPTQVVVIPVGEKFNEYGGELAKTLKDAGIRVELHDSDDTLGKRIRTAKMQKPPYVIVVGQKEVDSQTITIESRDKGQIKDVKLTDFIADIKKEIETKGV